MNMNIKMDIRMDVDPDTDKGTDMDTDTDMISTQENGHDDGGTKYRQSDSRSPIFFT
jgi:hypothetical protein